MSASAQIAAWPWEPLLVPGGTRVGAPLHGGRQDKARSHGTIMPFLAHIHTALPHGITSAHAQCLPPQLWLLPWLLWPCLNPGPVVQAAPPTTLTLPGVHHPNHKQARNSSTHPRALSCRHLAQPSQGVVTKQGSVALPVPARSQAAPESPWQARSPPTTTTMPVGAERRPQHQQQAAFQPQSGTCCHLPEAAMATAHVLLFILSSPDTWVTHPTTQGCSGSRVRACPVHLVRGTCCHPSPVPSSPHGFTGVPRVLTT